MPSYNHSNRHAAKLTPQQVARIRERFAAGVTATDLAQAFGITRTIVSNIVHYRTWKDGDEIRFRQ